MDYEKIEALCLDTSRPYRELKKELEQIFWNWRDLMFKQQLKESGQLLPVLQRVAQKKSRLSNYALERFFIEISDWGYSIYFLEEDWEDSKIQAMASQLADFATGMLETMERAKTKTSDRLRSEMVRLLGHLLECQDFELPLAILLDSMKVMDTDEQFFALEGLANYYAWEGTTLSPELIKELDEIVQTTKVRVNASSALQIQINAGVLDEFEAVVRMDSWKDRNWK